MPRPTIKDRALLAVLTACLPLAMRAPYAVRRRVVQMAMQSPGRRDPQLEATLAETVFTTVAKLAADPRHAKAAAALLWDAAAEKLGATPRPRAC